MSTASALFFLHLEEDFDEEEEESEVEEEEEEEEEEESEVEEEEEEEASQSEIDFEAETLDQAPFWSSSIFDQEILIPPTSSIFSPEISLHLPDYEDQITLSLDLFDRRPPPETLDTSDFSVLDAVEPIAPDYLGLGFDVHGPDSEPEEEDAPPMDSGLRAGGWLSDSDSEFDSHYHLPLCWDSLRFERDRRDLDDDFEWAAVDGRLDERDLLSIMVGERSRGSVLEEEDGDDEEGRWRNVDWAVLLAVSNVPVDEGDFIHPSEYEVLFEQFLDQESAIRGTPPAAKSVVSSLPSIVLTEEDVAKDNAICPVCKDDILLEEKVTQLPCLHHYHGQCILPWLGMRNTCPVCRYELPTDDPEYEDLRAHRRASNEGRYDFEMFPEELA